MTAQGEPPMREGFLCVQTAKGPFSFDATWSIGDHVQLVALLTRLDLGVRARLRRRIVLLARVLEGGLD